MLIRRKKRKTKLGIFALSLLLVLVFLGWYARVNFNHSLDSRFFDGISYALSVRAITEPTLFPTPTPKQKTETQQIFEEIEKVFGENAQTAKRVACCENQGKPNCSYLDPKKKGPTDDWGIFQIHRPSHQVPVKFLVNWRINIAIAKQLFDEQGWNPWRASKKCWEIN